MSASTRKVISMGLGTLAVAIVVAFLSNSLLSRVRLVPAFLVLAAIVVFHILADIVGTAAMAASEPPFHSMAANRLPGAREAIALVRNADRVANIANDLVGDVAGTIAGALGAAIVFRLTFLEGFVSATWLSTLMVALIAAITVGGKAGAKAFAIHRADDIILILGKVFCRIGSVLGITFFQGTVRSNAPRTKSGSNSRKDRRGRDEGPKKGSR